MWTLLDLVFGLERGTALGRVLALVGELLLDRGEREVLHAEEARRLSSARRRRGARGPANRSAGRATRVRASCRRLGVRRARAAAATVANASRCGRTSHSNHPPGTAMRNPWSSRPFSTLAVPSAASPRREQHDRFLADRRRPEREARREEHERGSTTCGSRVGTASAAARYQRYAPKNATMPNTRNAAIRSVPISDVEVRGQVRDEVRLAQVRERFGDSLHVLVGVPRVDLRVGSLVAHRRTRSSGRSSPRA